MIRFGIVGCGNMGKGHAQSMWDGKVKGAVLTAICDTNPKALEWAKEKDENVKTYDNVTAMFDSGEIDAVLIATPHYDHPIIAMEAMDKNIHVLTEKPAGVFTKNVRELNEKAKTSDVVFAIMFNQRTTPIYRKMREMVQNGELGTLKRTSWLVTDWYRPQAYYDEGGWRATWEGEGGGVLINQCPHNLDLWQWICGMPNRITAFTHNGKWHDIEVEDDVTAYVEYENGATGIFVTTTADCPGTNRFEIVGDLGKIVCENNELVHYKLDISEREFNKTNTVMFGSPTFTRHIIDCEEGFAESDLPLGAPQDGGSQHVGVLNAFVEKINGEGELIANGEEGINGLTISNAIHLSSWLGKTVELPLDEDLYVAELTKRFK